MEDDQKVYLRARKHAEDKAGFFVHLMIYIAVNTFLVLVWYTTSGLGSYLVLVHDGGVGNRRRGSLHRRVLGRRLRGEIRPARVRAVEALGTVGLGTPRPARGTDRGLPGQSEATIITKTATTKTTMSHFQFFLTNWASAERGRASGCAAIVSLDTDRGR